jgi:DNA-binding MarR family transcriptional regulator
MTSRLQAEIKQQAPWGTLEEEAFLNLVRTVDVLGQQGAAVLKPFAITPTQYNVLRILRGAGDGGLRCAEIAERLVTHDPDVTRLLDRLEKRELITRIRDAEDRRVVRTRVTAAGLDLLSQLDEPVTAMHRASLGHLGRSRLKELIALLEGVRAGVG